MNRRETQKAGGSERRHRSGLEVERLIVAVARGFPPLPCRCDRLAQTAICILLASRKSREPSGFENPQPERYCEVSLAHARAGPMNTTFSARIPLARCLRMADSNRHSGACRLLGQSRSPLNHGRVQPAPQSACPFSQYRICTTGRAGKPPNRASPRRSVCRRAPG
jgi:hypothetical protein